MKNVLAVVDNDKNIAGSSKKRAKIINSTILLAKEYYKHSLVVFSST